MQEEKKKGDMYRASDLLLMRVWGAISVKVLQQVEDVSIFSFLSTFKVFTGKKKSFVDNKFSNLSACQSVTQSGVFP